MGKVGSDLVGELVDGKYEILRCIGEGGMGVVYEVLHRGINRRCAIKVLHAAFADDKERLSRFEREAMITGSLGHPAIIEVTDRGLMPSGAPYLVMELLRGQSLAEHLAEEGVLQPEEAARIVGQILDALAIVHREGLIHRDLKPANIFLTEPPAGGGDDPSVKILDFGISKPVVPGLCDTSITGPGEILGSPPYISPEQFLGEELDRRTDLFSVGVMLYELLTGIMPFQGANAYDQVVKVMTTGTLPPSFHRANISAELDEVVLKAISSDRKLRFQSAEEFLSAIEPFVSQDFYHALRNSRPPESVGQTPIPEAGVEKLAEVDPVDAAADGDGLRESPVPARFDRRSGQFVVIAFVFILFVALGGFFLFPNGNEASSQGAVREDRGEPIAEGAALSAGQAPTEVETVAVDGGVGLRTEGGEAASGDGGVASDAIPSEHAVSEREDAQARPITVEEDTSRRAPDASLGSSLSLPRRGLRQRPSSGRDRPADERLEEIDRVLPVPSDHPGSSDDRESGP